MPDIKDKKFVERLTLENSPVITEPWATFIYRGHAEDVELVGEMTNWQKQGLKLKPLAETGMKYYSLPFLTDTRIEYQFIINGEWQLDSLNPNRADNGLGGINNFFTMPRYKTCIWTTEDADIPQGRIESLSEGSSNDHQTGVYLPPQYDVASYRYPTIYFIGGQNYLEKTKVNFMVDNLIAAKRILPLLMVFLPPQDYSSDYQLNKYYVEYISQELVPKVDERYRTIGSPQSRAIAGAALGGRLAVSAASIHSEVWGSVLGQSVPFAANEQLFDELKQIEPKNIKWFLEVGRYEPMLEMNRRMKEMLASNGYRVGYKEVSAGHNWTHWRDALASGLMYFFPFSNAE